MDETRSIRITRTQYGTEFWESKATQYTAERMKFKEFLGVWGHTIGIEDPEKGGFVLREHYNSAGAPEGQNEFGRAETEEEMEKMLYERLAGNVSLTGLPIENATGRFD